MYLVSAYFDSETNKILQGYINKIAAATGNDFMVKNNVPPHLTLSAIEARGVDVLLPHITLAKTLTREQMLDAVKVMQDFKSIKAKIVKIGLAKVNPHEDVSEILLG